VSPAGRHPALGVFAAWRRYATCKDAAPAERWSPKVSAIARNDNATLMWCNARVGARGFYEKLGFIACRG
jgi:hypothetical protein